MSEAHHMLGRLREGAARLRDRTVLVRTAQLREAQSTLALSDLHVAFLEIMTSEVSGQPPASPVEAKVRRVLKVSEEAVRRVRTAPVGETLFWAATAMSQPPSGPAGPELPWRTEAHWFGGPDASSAYLLAPPPGADLRSAVEQWRTWVDTTTELQVIGKLALGAYQLYTLAPFAHTDDLVHFYVSLELIKARALEDQYATISVWLDANRGLFRELHREVVDTGNWEKWIAFFAEGIVDLCDRQLRLVGALELERQRHFELLPTRNDALARVVDVLPSNPIVNAQLIAGHCGVSVRQSRTLLKKLESYQLLKEIGNRKRNKLYEVPRVMRLLNLYDGQMSTKDLLVLDKNAG